MVEGDTQEVRVDVGTQDACVEGDTQEVRVDVGTQDACVKGDTQEVPVDGWNQGRGIPKPVFLEEPINTADEEENNILENASPTTSSLVARSVIKPRRRLSTFSGNVENLRKEVLTKLKEKANLNTDDCPEKPTRTSRPSSCGPKKLSTPKCGRKSSKGPLRVASVPRNQRLISSFTVRKNSGKTGSM